MTAVSRRGSSELLHRCYSSEGWRHFGAAHEVSGPDAYFVRGSSSFVLRHKSSPITAGRPVDQGLVARVPVQVVQVGVMPHPFLVGIAMFHRPFQAVYGLVDLALD